MQDAGTAIRTVEQLMGKKFSDEQIKVLSTTGGMRILATAGSGKTTTIIALIAKRALTGEYSDVSKLLCTTFSKVGAQEIEDRASRLFKTLGIHGFHCSTIHSACYHILQKFGALQQFTVIDDRDELDSIARWTKHELGKKFIDADTIRGIQGCMTAMVNRCCTANDIKSDLENVQLTVEQFTHIFNNFKAENVALQRITYDDMLSIVDNWLNIQKYQAVIDYCRETWEHFIIDEYQDTSILQNRILLALIGGETHLDRMVAVGDDDQCIYEWRGAEPSLIVNMSTYQNMSMLTIPINYRCPSYIVEHADYCIRNNTMRVAKNMRAHQDGGQIKLYDALALIKSGKGKYKRYYNIIADNAAREIMSILNGNNGVVQQHAICCLSRNNKQLCMLTAMLFKQNIAVNVNKSMYITNQPEWETVEHIVDFVRTQGKAERQVIQRLIPYCSNRLAQLIDDAAASINGDIIYTLLRVTCGSREEVESRYGYAYNGQELSDVALSYMRSEISRCHIDDSYMLMIATNVYKGGNKAISDLIKLAELKVTEEFSSALYEYIRVEIETEGIESMERLNKRMKAFSKGVFASDDRVDIRTIHGAKGGEWQFVFLLYDDTFIFPNYAGLKNQKNLDELNKLVEGERRLHYVAQTRASSVLYIFTRADKVSPFVVESFGKPLGVSIAHALRRNTENLIITSTDMSVIRTNLGANYIDCD